MTIRVGRSVLFSAVCFFLLFGLSPSIRAQAVGTLDSVYVVPNPYNVAGRTFGPRSDIPGYERMRFANLPTPCTVKIYTSAANLVTTLHFAEGTLLPAWDGRNSDNQYVVSDVYFYVIEHKTLGRKIGKFVVIR